MASMFVPQLVTPVDTSGIARLGNTIGTLKQDSEIASIMKGIDPYDPNSKQRVISDLRIHGSREARDMADRLEGLDIRRQMANQQGEYQKGQLDVARGGLSLKQQEFGRQQEEDKAFREGLAKYGRGGGLAAVPPASAAGGAPSAPAGRGVPAAAPTEPEEEDFWKDATPEEGGRAKPKPQSKATPIFQAPPVVGGFSTQPAPGMRAAGGLLATAPAPAAPLPPPPPAPVGGTAGTGTAGVPAPQGILPALVAGATYAALPGASAAPATPAAAGAPAPAATQVAAAETEGDLPGTEELPPPGTPQPRATVDYTPRQIELRQANRNLGMLMDYARTPGRQRALQTHIDENNAEFAEIEAARTRGDKEREAARKVVTGQAAKDRSKLLMEMGQQTQGNIDLKDKLIALKRVTNSPNYPGGGLVKPRVYIGQLGVAVDGLLKSFGMGGLSEKLGEDAFNRWVQDPVSRARTAESLINAITLQGLGGKLGTAVSNTDREFVAKTNATLSDDPKTVARIADMHLALIERQDLMHRIAVQGEAQGKTASQIQARLARFGKENPLFEHANGKPTPLGRQIDPARAREWDAEQQAAKAQAVKIREEFRDPGAGEAAVIGARPTAAQKRATAEFDAAIRDVPGRPVTGAGSSRGETGREVREAVTEGISARLPTQEDAREFFLGDNPVANWMRSQGTIGPNVGRAPGVGAGQVPAPQRAGEGIDMNQDMGMESIGGIVNQGTRLAPGGIPWEAYRRSTNIENRPQPNEVPMPLAQQQMTAYDWLQDAERQPVGPLSRAAGLADLEARAYARPGGGVQIPAGLPLPPLPRRKPRREEKRR